MKLTEIREGVVVRCPECDCGQADEGYVEGQLYFTERFGCECQRAYHVGSDFPFAREFCPKCSASFPNRKWKWLAVNPRNIKVIREGKS